MNLRNLIKYGALAHHRLFGHTPDNAVSILMYHRVTGDVPIELDLPFDIFEQQMAWLADQGAVMPYAEAVDSLLQGHALPGLRYALTFDDAYADFYTHAWPVLRKYQLPATLFVPTGFIDVPSCPPLSRDVPHADRLQPMTWEQLREVVADPLMTLGTHTHNHPELSSLTSNEIAQEMETAASRFTAELGFAPKHFAYPRGRWNARAEHGVRPYCATAAIVGGVLARPENVGRYTVPRVPVRRGDGWNFFRARATGALVGEERLIAFAKGLRRAMH